MEESKTAFDLKMKIWAPVGKQQGRRLWDLLCKPLANEPFKSYLRLRLGFTLFIPVEKLNCSSSREIKKYKYSL